MDLLKNIVYAGVGLAANTSDKVKETIDELVEKGKISDTEGRKIVDDFFKNTSEKREEFEAKIKELKEGVTSRFDFLKKEGEELKDKVEDTVKGDVVDSLKKEIEELKAQLKEAKASSKKTAASTRSRATTAAKKTTTTARKTAASARKATTSTTQKTTAAKKTTARATTTAKKSTTTKK